MMEREPLNSSNLKSVGYDSAKRVLEVEFGSGQVFQYSDVEPERHVKLLMASRAPEGSAGKYFHSYVRGKYPAKKLEPPKETE